MDTTTIFKVLDAVIIVIALSCIGASYFIVTSLIYVKSFITGADSVRFNLNTYGERNLEILLSFVSIPCVIYLILRFFRILQK